MNVNGTLALLFTWEDEVKRLTLTQWFLTWGLKQIMTRKQKHFSAQENDDAIQISTC